MSKKNHNDDAAAAGNTGATDKRTRLSVESNISIDHAPRSSLFARLFPWLVVIIALICIAASMTGPFVSQVVRYNDFGKLPVLHEGRVKPVDTFARSTLLLLSNRQVITIDGNEMPAIRWLLEVVAKPEKADDYAVFRVDHPDIRAILTDPKHAGAYNYFSYHEIVAKAAPLTEQFQRAFAVADKERNLYQSKLVDLSRKLRRYQDVTSLEAFTPVTSADVTNLPKPTGDSLDARIKANPALGSFVEILGAYRTDKPGDFNAGVDDYQHQVDQHAPALSRRMETEWFFHDAEPFYNAMVMYVVVFLLAIFSWLFWAKPLGRAAVALALVALVLHTVALATRVYLHGHPPITNLYASAIFIGWACVVLALVLELIYRNAIGSAAAGVAGFVTLLIAHNLSDGDNLEAVRAVLNTSLWLSTHVVVVTIGYASTFLAGFLAILYVLRGVFTRSLTPDTARNLARMIYGIICFAALASFVGTILGGIWADQSWGRFWGWDPKENGALLIVMMNILILHAKWGGMVRERGMAVLAICGNIVTSWSWFGVNMLGVGLHSYGFMDKAFWWLIAFVVSQLVLMAIGLVPLRYWRSFNEEKAERAVHVRSRGKPATT